MQPQLIWFLFVSLKISYHWTEYLADRLKKPVLYLATVITTCIKELNNNVVRIVTTRGTAFLFQQQMAVMPPGQQAPIMAAQISQQQNAAAASPSAKGSIVTGYPVRTQSATSTYQSTSAVKVRGLNVMLYTVLPIHDRQTIPDSFCYG